MASTVKYDFLYIRYHAEFGVCASNGVGISRRSPKMGAPWDRGVPDRLETYPLPSLATIRRSQQLDVVISALHT